MKAILILGNQLFEPKILKKQFSEWEKYVVYIREDFELCTYYKFHKHKIILFIGAMRAYCEELKEAGFQVHYEILEKNELSYEKNFTDFLNVKKIKEVVAFEIEDKFFEKRILSALQEQAISLKIFSSPQFLTSREDFKSYLKTTKKPFMKTFYQKQRIKLNILLKSDKTPLGGKWSFDDENRKPIPTNIIPPSLLASKTSTLLKTVIEVCDLHFKTHPGETKNFWLPIKREDARLWLNHFLNNKLPQFGPYEDALAPHSDFVFHSVLTPFLNTGLLTPQEIVKETIQIAESKQIPIQSVEGFIRQVIGWREFIRGVYQNFSQQQDSSNFWDHQRHLTNHWYEGTTGVLPLDNSLKKVIKYGYAHHIERLMVIGNLMLLLEVHPKEAYNWFMEMFIDSSDWVMTPNVFGMALFSDGGIFATKPYICGSNYYKKMGGYKTSDWCDAVDGLYWQFIEKQF